MSGPGLGSQAGYVEVQGATLSKSCLRTSIGSSEVSDSGICKSRCLTSLTLLSDTLSNVQKAINGISWYIIVYHEANAGHSEQGGKVAMPPFEASHSFASPFR